MRLSRFGPIRRRRSRVRPLALAVLSVLPLALPTSTAAGQAFGVGTAAAISNFSVGSQSNRGTGITVFAFLARTDGGIRRQYVEAEATLFEPRSPVLDEALRALTVRGHIVLGSDWFVAPGVGGQFRSWSGSERVEESDWGPVFALEAGFAYPLGGGPTLIPTLLGQWSGIQLEGSVAVSLLELRVALMW